MFPRKWQKTIDIKKDLYSDNLSLKEKAQKIYNLLKSELESSDSQSTKRLRVFSLDLEAGLDLLEEAGEVDDVELFDEGLALIYDWADENRVWLGF